MMDMLLAGLKVVVMVEMRAEKMAALWVVMRAALRVDVKVEMRV
jgi:hypothetical protein